MKTAPKRRGRPPGVKNKTAPKEVMVPSAAIKAQVDFRTEHLETIIADLRHQIIGFQAVISYLENQLGLKKSI